MWVVQYALTVKWVVALVVVVTESGRTVYVYSL